jgi:hypothetical protein
MKQLVAIYLGILCGMWLLPLPSQAAISVSDGTLLGRPVTTIETDLLRMVVTREIGGRILSLVDKRSGNEFIAIRKGNMHFQPTDNWAGGEYGGICDVETDGWPGNFWDKTYDLKIERRGEARISLRFTAEAVGTAIERVVTLEEGSTRVHFAITQTNLSDYAKPMMVRLHNEYRLGACADNNDYAYWIDPKGEAREMRYILGTEKTGWRNGYRFRFIDVLGWFGVVDRVEGVALIGTYPNPDKPSRVFWWNGYNEGDQRDTEWDETHGHFNFDYFGPKVKTEPGASLSGEQDLFFIRGLNTALRLVNPQVTIAADMDRGSAVYGTAEPIGALVQAGSPEAVALVSGEAKLVAANRPDQPIRTFPLRFEGITAGDAVAQQVTIPAGLLKDGKYQLICMAQAGEQALGQFTLAFTVDSAAVDAVVARQAELLKRLAAQRKAITRVKQQMARERLTLLAGIGDVRLQDAKAALTAGDFTLTRERLQRLASLLDDIDDELAAAKRASTSSRATEKELKGWLDQLK